jgi:hypothetical protein
MSAFRLCFGAACAVLMLSAGSFPQGPSITAVIPKEEAIRAMLLSGEPRQVAWGAYYVAAAHYESLVPDLLTLADQWEQPTPLPADESERDAWRSEQRDKRDAQAEVLDTLIQLNAAVPAETLRKLAPEFQNEVAVLLSRMPAEEAGPLAFDFYRSPPEGDYSLQYVSAALLAQHPVPGFVADLLSETRPWFNVYVVLPDSEEGGGGQAGSCGPSFPSPHEDWPKIGQYVLSFYKSDSGVVLVPGVDPIYATRKTLDHYDDYSCGKAVLRLGAERRRRLVAQMLGISPDAIPWETGGRFTIVFRTTQQFQSELLGFADAEQAKYRTTTAALVDRGLLTQSEAEDALPHLQLNLWDQCDNCTFPTPTLALPHVDLIRDYLLYDPND